ncbi:hypothetical protein K504DRAFT_371436 [Pleomassaria siparia CBS 279.74]|uniref:Uncharacterized protein n=1 Tax=Pleomassaria siparia CBS 279.74 TaxID=1314801 RepID=A0A6G1KKC1_9PLEO|nr:hypothetical protein K504DRAFT_371436 [Pleomassaria siparia CBS 279.74]
MINIRQHNYDQEEVLLDDQPVVATSCLSETLSEKRLRWSALLGSHQYHTVISQVLAEELPKYTRSTVIPTSLSSIIRECVLILASAPLIFTAVVDGVLTSQIRTSQVLQREYDEIQGRASAQPSIYVHLLADMAGVAPSANQYMLIQEVVLKYIGDTDPELVYLIDNVTPPGISMEMAIRGHRKQLWTGRNSSRRFQTLARFCEGIRARWLETPHGERDMPFAHPPGECGYALNAHARLRQHRRRQSSNYVMNLTEDVCSYLYTSGILPSIFTMHQYIIYLIFRPSQIRIAEIFCSGLLQVWVDNGGGFNHYPAGLSNASGDKVVMVEWAEHEKYTRTTSRLEGNVSVQRNGLEEAVYEMDEEMAEAWRRAFEGQIEGDKDGNIAGEWVSEVGHDDTDMGQLQQHA